MRSRANPGGTSVSYTPSPSNGIDITIVDERGKTTVQDWVAFGEPTDCRLAGITDADGKGWTYTYNALGNLTRVHPPTGPDRTWVYYGNEAGGKPGLLKTETHPESGAVGYTYDSAGRMETRADALFGTSIFGYDSDDRLTSVDRPGGASHDKTFGWDDRNNRTLLENKYVKSTFAYDGVNRLRSRTDVVNPCYPATSCTTRTFVTGYSDYDGNDNLRQVDYPSGTTVTYLHDSENRITSVGKPGAAGAFASSFTYHPSGGIWSYLAGNQMTHTTTYNARHAVETIDAGGVLGLTYTYDNALNPETISESTRIGMNQIFTYDNLNRLQTSGPWGSATFDYYAPGNRRTKTIGSKTTTYNYNSSTGRLDSATGAEAATYCYDSNGNMTFGGPGSCTTQFTFTPDNMIFSAASATGTTSYRYDADDVRTVKTFDATKNYYTHGLGGQLLSELVEDGMGLRGVRDYVYAGSRLIAAVRPTVAPFGYLDTPAESATGLAGAIAVTGWALDEREVTRVSIWRDPSAGEPGGQVYLGDGTFIPGARPDVAAAYPAYPNATRAGWGLSVLSNMLPNHGNGSLVLHAYAHDADGNQTLLGSKHVTLDNAHSTKPFGTLDTPGQGQTVSGSVYVWGWALTPQPGVIPVDGSTIWYSIDSQYSGHPVYNLYRSDIAGAFPGYANSDGAVGYSVVDTTLLANGIHTIGWLVTDNLGQSEGLGSRFFWVQN